MATRTVALESEGINITGQLYLPGEGNRAPYRTVCICHGIPAGIPDPGNTGYPLLAERICRQGIAVFIFNFRGTGASGGNFDIMGWTRDLKSAIDYLCSLPEVDRARLSLLGFSGGAAVSVYVAAKDDRISAIVTCACPAEFTFLNKADSHSSLIEHFRSIGIFRDRDYPPSLEDWLNNFRVVSPIEYIADIAPRPLLLIHGDRDETVDVSHAYRLYERAGEPRQIKIIYGAGHRLRQNEKAMDAVINWLESLR